MASEGEAGAAGTMDVHDSFRVLGEKTMRLRRKVRELKTLYVSAVGCCLLLLLAYKLCGILQASIRQ